MAILLTHPNNLQQLTNLILKTLIAILILTTLNSVYGQGVKFQIKRINPCDRIGKIDSSDYYLSDNLDSNYYAESGIVKLPKPGIYNVHFWTYRDIAFPKINILDTGLLVYTFNEPKIILRSYGMHPRFVYESCGKLINGYDEDFYSNGNIRIRGNFQEGKPKDSVVTFFSNGIIEKRLTFLPKEILIEEFDSTANLIKVSRNSNKSYYLTDYNTTEYYTTGKIKRIESNIKRLVNIKEFYANGQLKIIQTKKYRNEYYEDGSKEITITWRRKKVKEIKGEYRFEFKIHKTKYNRNGEKVEEIVYEDWRLLQPQPRLEVSSSDWIYKWTKYENNKEIIIANEVATKDYFKLPKD